MFSRLDHFGHNPLNLFMISHVTVRLRAICGLAIKVKLQHVTGLHTQLRSLACIEFQHVFCRTVAGISRTPARAARRCVFRHADQRKITVEIKYIQRYPGVFHPETTPGLTRENKQHAMIIRHAVSKHQTQCPFFIRIRQFNHEPFTIKLHVRPLRHAGTADKKNGKEKTKTHGESLNAAGNFCNHIHPPSPHIA